jgi:WD repeat-containing protein 35
LQIQAVQLDEVMQQPEQPGKQHVFSHETKTLRDMQQMLRAVDIQDAYSYIEEHSHPRLWISLANHALEKLDLSFTEKASVSAISSKVLSVSCEFRVKSG